MPNKTIVKSPEQVIADHFGYCTLEMLRGNCKTVAEDPLQDLVCDDGLPHSDLALLKKTQFDASVAALVDMRFRPRVVSSSDSVVGTRHISLSEAFNACKSAASALDLQALKASESEMCRVPTTESDDGLPHSDLALLKKTQFDASVAALVDMRFRPRVVSSSDSVVGTRHISLSEAFNACKSAASALDSAISDARVKLSKPVETAPSNDGNQND